MLNDISTLSKAANRACRCFKDHEWHLYDAGIHNYSQCLMMVHDMVNGSLIVNSDGWCCYQWWLIVDDGSCSSIMGFALGPVPFRLTEARHVGRAPSLHFPGGKNGGWVDSFLLLWHNGWLSLILVIVTDSRLISITNGSCWFRMVMILVIDG